MIRLLLTTSLLLNLVWIISADLKGENEEIYSIERRNCGYKIIEFGKGIDCNGDTIRLERCNGIQARISKQAL